MQLKSLVLPLTAAIATALPLPVLQAGEESTKMVTLAEEDSLPGGVITLGGQVSEDLSSGYLDSITPFWAPGDALLFLNTRSSLDDNSQSVSSVGLGFRHLFPDREIILGANAYYDMVNGQDGSDFGQLGLGAEILTRWVDARFNYYRPDDDQIQIERFQRQESSREVGGAFRNGNLIQQNTTDGERRQTFRTFEAGLEGWNAEVGFLIPGLDRYLETRVFGGYYSYDNPFGGDYEGFKARLEAHLLPGVIADVEYWDDAYLTGGHWTAGARVRVPFSIFNLVTGRNPFEGAGEMFRPRKREFKERQTDMVIRSHRVKTVTSDPILTNTQDTEKVTTNTIGVVPTPTPRPRSTPPPVENPS